MSHEKFVLQAENGIILLIILKYYDIMNTENIFGIKFQIFKSETVVNNFSYIKDLKL